jgi:hypothetical protein
MTSRLSDAMRLLQRMYPQPQDVPAREIAYGYLTKAACRDFVDGGDRVGSEAAILASSLAGATEMTIQTWVRVGAERLAERDAEDRAQRARENQIIRDRIARFRDEANRVREREAAQSECDRLMPELVDLCRRYAPNEDAEAHARHEVGRRTKAADLLPRLRQKVQWFTNALAEREQRAPLAARCLDHVTGNPGVGDDALASALGADRHDIREAMEDLYRYAANSSVRREWKRDYSTSRTREHYYPINEEEK